MVLLNMKLALIGATGFVGSAVLNEALNRGHQVTAIARNTDKILIDDKNLTLKDTDVYHTGELAAAISGNKAVISTFNSGWENPNIYEDFMRVLNPYKQQRNKQGSNAYW